MNNTREYELLKQKIRLKELSGLDTSKEEEKQLMLTLDEIKEQFTAIELATLYSQISKEEKAIDDILGSSQRFPLLAIEKLLPYAEMLYGQIITDTGDKTMRSFLNTICDRLAAYSRMLVAEQESVPLNDEDMFSMSDLESLSRDDIKSKWIESFKTTLGSTKEAYNVKDNIKLCSYCQNLWNLSNIGYIFF